MKRFFVFLVLVSCVFHLSAFGPAFAADQAELLKKIEAMTKELESLKQQVQEMQKKEAAQEKRISSAEKKADEAKGPSWFEIGGDYRFRFDSLFGRTHDAKVIDSSGNAVANSARDVKNDSLLTNRFGLNFRIKATEDVQVKARLLMYKVWGHQTEGPAAGSNNSFFSDKQNVFDGNISHVPQDSVLRVDQAFATWTNVFDEPVWFSVGRRPSTGGMPTNLRQNTAKTGTAGAPGLLVDWAFDGISIGYVPDIDGLPGSFVKVCYGKGFDSGFRPNNGLRDVTLVGLDVVPYDTDNLRAEAMWVRALDIYAFPERTTNSLGYANTNLGDIDLYGLMLLGRINKVGSGDLNLFLSAGMSRTHPNNKTYAGSYGLLWDTVSGKKSRTGYAAYIGGRYDYKPTNTKIGLEYNHGTKYWMSFSPASDDIWTSKLGARGDVYEIYLIQDLNKTPISKKGKAFFRLGYQYYVFKYTGSNNWVGAPYKIADLTTSSDPAQFFAPVKTANDIYLTFDVLF
jgi:hypothetical protein